MINNNRKGNTTVEFALTICLVLVPMLIGIFDSHSFFQLNTALRRAAREGVVIAARGQDPIPAVNDFINGAGYDSTKVTVSYSSAESDAGTDMNLQLSYNADSIALLPLETVFPGITQATAVARME